MLTEIEQLSELVRDLYIAQRRFIHPWFKPNDEKYPKAWEKTARFILENNCDPELYIAAQFEGRKFGFPYPNQLYSEWALKKYREYASTRQKDLTLQLQLELDRLEAALWRSEDLKTALSDEIEDFSTIFKFCVLKKFNLDCPSSLAKAAKLYLMTHLAAVDIYSKLWSGLREWWGEQCNN